MHSLRKDETGTSVIELALIAPILAAMVVGMIDLSTGFAQRLTLEQAAQRAVERAMQGMQGSTSVAIFNDLTREAAEAAGVPQSAVTVRFWMECNGVSQMTSVETMVADYQTAQCTNGQRYSRHLSVRILKTYRPMFPMNWGGRNPDGTFTIEGEAGLRVQ